MQVNPRRKHETYTVIPAGTQFYCSLKETDLVAENGDKGIKSHVDEHIYMYRIMCPVCGQPHNTGLLHRRSHRDKVAPGVSSPDQML